MYLAIFMPPNDDIPLFKLLQHELSPYPGLSEWLGWCSQNILDPAWKLPDDNTLSPECTYTDVSFTNSFCMSPWWIHLGFRGPLNGDVAFSESPGSVPSWLPSSHLSLSFILPHNDNEFMRLHPQTISSLKIKAHSIENGHGVCHEQNLPGRRVDDGIWT